jgi:hypothetical protein
MKFSARIQVSLTAGQRSLLLVRTCSLPFVPPQGLCLDFDTPDGDWSEGVDVEAVDFNVRTGELTVHANVPEQESTQTDDGGWRDVQPLEYVERLQRVGFTVESDIIVPAEA